MISGMKKQLHCRYLSLLWAFSFLIFSAPVFANQQAALDWLATQQVVDGSYTATTSSLATPVQSVAEVIRAQQATGQPATASSAALLYLNNDTDLNTEYLARKVIVNATAGNDVTALTNTLIARQNLDGGFGDQAGYASNVLDTAFVLEVLSSSGQVSNSIISAAIQYLQNEQQADGG